MTLNQIEYFCAAAHLDWAPQIPPDPELEQIPIAYQKLCLLLPKDRAAADYVMPQQLEKENLICYRKDYPMYRLLTAKFASLDIHPSIGHYGYSESAIARLVEQRIGIAVVAETDGLERYDIRICHPQWLEGGRQLYLLRHRTRNISQAASLLQQKVLAAKERYKGETS